MKPQKIAVIGGGVFGSTSAIFLAKYGHKVTLFEAKDDLFKAASGINQYRMHRGYHYPRSSETIESCYKATPQFEAFYQPAIIDSLKHYYGIAKHKSFLTGEEYLRVLDTHQLPYEVVSPDHLNHDVLDVVVKVEENVYDPYRLKQLATEKLEEQNVDVRLNTPVQIGDLDDYDKIVIATYASLNQVFGEKTEFKREYQYEVCEKIVLDIPPELKNISTVIMDGPFMCLDPLGDTDKSLMGHVEHAIHKRSFGNKAEVPDELLPILNQGIIKNPPISNHRDFLSSGQKFIPALKEARYFGSMFTIRTVLPRVDDTDTRPTIVNVVDDRIITVYSGKIGNSIKAAEDVVALVHG